MSWLRSTSRIVARPCSKHIQQSTSSTQHVNSYSMHRSRFMSSNAENQKYRESQFPKSTHTESNRSRFVGYALFLTLAGVAVTLGVWQVNRRAWKIDLINKRQSAMEAEPVDWLSFIAKNGPQIDADHEFQKVRLSVRFDYDHEFFVGPRGVPMQDVSNPSTALSQQGSLVITPALVEGSHQVILVNRGWVDKNCKKAPRESNPNGYVEVVGVTRRGDERPRVLALFPDDSKNQTNKFLFVDVEGMRRALNLPESLPLNVIDVISPSSSTDLVRPPLSSYISFAVMPMRHAAYAVSWFGIATAITVGTLMRFKRPAAAKASTTALITALSTSDDSSRTRR